MNPDWKKFLSTQAAPVDEGTVTQEFISDLSHLSIIEITGQDATEFLNGQFTSNIKQLAKHHLQFSAWCNPKGQVKTTFLIYRHESGFNVLLPNQLKEIFLKQLQMYIMRADVQLTDNSEELVRIGLTTEHATILDALLEKTPEQQGDITLENDLHCLQTFSSDNNATTSRYLLIGSPGRIKGLWESLAEQLTTVGTSSWQLLDIKAGYPWLSTTTAEKFLPQMLNLDLINGLDYQKGCYPGQEIIARLNYRGQLKRSLYLSTCSLDARPEIADQLYANDRENSIGIVINAQVFEDKYYLLAVIEKESLENHLSLREPDGPNISLLKLPYQKE